jgi:hypothetical protein
MAALTVKCSLERLNELDGQFIEVFGQLSVDFEDMCLNHTDTLDDQGREEPIYCSEWSLWTIYNLKALNTTEEALKRLHRQDVVLVGRLKKPKKGYDGCGHMSAWPAEIEVVEVRQA